MPPILGSIEAIVGRFAKTCRLPECATFFSRRSKPFARHVRPVPKRPREILHLHQLTDQGRSCVGVARGKEDLASFDEGRCSTSDVAKLDNAVVTVAEWGGPIDPSRSGHPPDHVNLLAHIADSGSKLVNQSTTRRLRGRISRCGCHHVDKHPADNGQSLQIRGCLGSQLPSLA